VRTDAVAASLNIVISEAEILLGLTRHLNAYAHGPARAALAQLEFAGQILEMAVRLRGSGVSPGRRVVAIGLEAGIAKRRLVQEVLPVLQSLSLIEFQQNHDNKLLSVTEQIPPLPILLNLAESILDIVQPDSEERAIVTILDATTKMPITRDSALEEGSAVSSERAANRALDLMEALHLVKVIRAKETPDVVFNPNVWSSDVNYSSVATRAEDSTVRAALSGLIEEIDASPGIPQASVTSTDRKWIDYAVSQGLVQRSIVATSDGNEQAFLFTPHMGKSAFGSPHGFDPSGHVRLLIGSMVYAKSFAHIRLNYPAVFLRKLIREGEAGDASSIGSDYPMLETAGIVRVERADRYYKLVLLQSDVAEEALDYLNDPADSDSFGARGLRDQRKYVHPERERARVELARAAEPNTQETQRIISDLRQVAGNRHFGR